MSAQYLPPELYGPHMACCDQAELLTFYLRMGTGALQPIAQAEMHVSRDEQANNKAVAQFLRTVANVLDADGVFDQMIDSFE